MEPVRPDERNAGKVIAAVLLIGLGLAGLAMSLCGGFFTSVTLYDLVAGHSNGGESAQLGVLFLVAGGGSFAVGLLVMFLAVVVWKRVVAAQRP